MSKTEHALRGVEAAHELAILVHRRLNNLYRTRSADGVLERAIHLEAHEALLNVLQLMRKLTELHALVGQAMAECSDTGKTNTKQRDDESTS